MRFSLTTKLFLVILFVFLGVLFVEVPIQAESDKLCGVHGDTCKEGRLERCCTGTICRENKDGTYTCVGGLFTRGQSDTCLEQGNCSRCDFLIVVKNVFQFLVQIAGGLTILSIVVAGIMYMLGGGVLGILTTQAGAVGVERAKAALTTAIIGLVIVLFAWSVITWIMHFLGYTNPLGSHWWEIRCG